MNKLIDQKVFKRNEIMFLTRSGGEFEVGARLAQENQFDVIPMSDENLEWNSPKEALTISQLNFGHLIIDRLDTSFGVVASAKEKGKSVICFDDLGEGGTLASLVINGIVEKKNPNERYFQGYQYLFLRGDDFDAQSPVKNRVDIFASFGGYDHRNLVGVFFDALRAIVPKLRERRDVCLHIVVALGHDGAFRNKWNLDDLQREFASVSLKIRFVNGNDDFYSSLRSARIAVVSGGLTLFESLRYRTATCALSQYPHQGQTISKLAELGACLKVETEAEVQDLANKIYLLLSDERQVERVANKGADIIDGNGEERVTKLLRRFYSTVK